MEIEPPGTSQKEPAEMLTKKQVEEPGGGTSASPNIYLDMYVSWICKYKYSIVIISWILILVAGFIGKDAFSKLSDGGFAPPRKQSTYVQNYMSAHHLSYPEYTVVLETIGLRGLTVDNPKYQVYYESVLSAMQKTQPVFAVISYYDVLDSSMVSGDRSKVLIYATVKGSIDSALFLQAVEAPIAAVSGVEFSVLCGGSVLGGLELSESILKGVETAEFSTLPIIFVLLIFALNRYSLQQQFKITHSTYLLNYLLTYLLILSLSFLILTSLAL